MKRILFTSTIIALAFAGCEKDPCKDVSCLNDGICVDGSCLCPEGFSGEYCQTQVQNDPCEGITCLNNGNCVNGLCDCPEGYTGANCGQQQTPSKITVTKITVLKFPVTDQSGGSWDLSSFPDIYPVFALNGNEFWTSPVKYDDATSPGNYPFNYTIDLNSPTQQYALRLYDADSPSADDYMGGVVFTPYSSNSGFPTLIELETSNFKYWLELSYEW